MTSAERVRRVGVAVLMALLSFTVSAEAQEYRGYWVDTSNMALNTHADVVAVGRRRDLSLGRYRVTLTPPGEAPFTSCSTAMHDRRDK